MGTGWVARQERRRVDVLAAAGELIASGGVDGLSMRKLAERADVAVGTLYNQFGDRDGILVAYVSAGLDELERRIDAAPAADAIATTRQLFEALDAVLSDNVAVWQPVFAVMRSGPELVGIGAVGQRFVALVEQDLAKAAADGMFRIDVDTRMLAEHIVQMRIARIERWAAGIGDWDGYVKSSRLGLEVTLAAVLTEPYASEALARSGAQR